MNQKIHGLINQFLSKFGTLEDEIKDFMAFIWVFNQNVLAKSLFTAIEYLFNDHKYKIKI